MTSSAAKKNTPVEFVKKALARKGITKIAIVDDDYDAPQKEELEAKFSGFWDAARLNNKKGAAFKELKKLGFEPNSQEELADDNLIKALWDNLDNPIKIKALKVPCEKHFFNPSN